MSSGSQAQGDTRGARTAWADLSDSSREEVLDNQPKRQRVAWSDLCDSSREEFSANQPPPAPLNVNSYIATPEPSFDYEHGSVIRRLPAAIALNAGSSSSPLTDSQASSSSRAVPTVISIDPLAMQSLPQESQSSDASEHVTDGSPRPEAHFRPTRLKRPRPTSIFDATRRESQQQVTHAVVDAIVTANHQAEQQEAAAMPESTVALSEEDWNRRNTKRLNVVRSTKTSPEYAAMTVLREQGVPCPPTPDGNDRSISKRKWESLVINWKRELHRLYEANP